MSAFSQAFPPSPTFTEKELPDQTGKVILITGAASGLGRELAKILYSRNAIVYIGARSPSRVQEGIKSIQAAIPSSKGRLESFVVDLANLETIKPAVETFLQREEGLHVLMHNAGVMLPPAGSKTKQGYDLELGTNCLGPSLLNSLLEPVLRRTAISEGVQQSASQLVRVVWLASMVATGTPKGGVVFDGSAPSGKLKAMDNYMQSKAGNVLLASEFAKKVAGDGILSISVNPGLLRTELQRNNAVMSHIMGVVFKPAKYGAYTELYAGFSDKVTAADNGGFFIPWGRRGPIPAHIERGLKTEEEGGTGVGKRFYEWCAAETRKYVE